MNRRNLVVFALAIPFAGCQDKRLVAVRPNGQEDTAEFILDVDHAKAEDDLVLSLIHI